MTTPPFSFGAITTPAHDLQILGHAQPQTSPQRSPGRSFASPPAAPGVDTTTYRPRRRPAAGAGTHRRLRSGSTSAGAKAQVRIPISQPTPWPTAGTGDGDVTHPPGDLVRFPGAVKPRLAPDPPATRSIARRGKRFLRRPAAAAWSLDSKLKWCGKTCFAARTVCEVCDLAHCLRCGTASCTQCAVSIYPGSLSKCSVVSCSTSVCAECAAATVAETCTMTST